MINSSPIFSAFDLDHTLLKQNSSFAFGKYLYQKKHISLGAFLFIIRSSISHRLGLLSLTDVHKRAFERLFLGRSLPLVEAWVSDFLDNHFDHLTYTPALVALNKAKQEGQITAIMSSSPSFLVEPISRRLGLSFCQATQYSVDPENKFCKIANLVLGEDKARFIDAFISIHHIGKQQVIAYSDSFLDLPFLLAAGKAVAVNPDRKLRRFCKKNNWLII